MLAYQRYSVEGLKLTWIASTIVLYTPLRHKESARGFNNDVLVPRQILEGTRLSSSTGTVFHAVDRRIKRDGCFRSHYRKLGPRFVGNETVRSARTESRFHVRIFSHRCILPATRGFSRRTETTLSTVEASLPAAGEEITFHF